MTRLGIRNRNTGSAGRVLAAAVVGSVVGAMISRMLRPSRAGHRTGRLPRITADVHERAKTAEENVESQARELAEQVEKASGTVSHGAESYFKGPPKS
jgi:hypothetical protein